MNLKKLALPLVTILLAGSISQGNQPRQGQVIGSIESLDQGQSGDFRVWLHNDWVKNRQQGPAQLRQRLVILREKSQRLVEDSARLLRAIRGDNELSRLEQEGTNFLEGARMFRELLRQNAPDQRPGMYFTAIQRLYEAGVSSNFDRLYNNYLRLMRRDSNGEEISFFNNLGLLAAAGETNAVIKDMLALTVDEPIAPPARDLALGNLDCFGGKECADGGDQPRIKIVNDKRAFRYIKFNADANGGDKARGSYRLYVNGKLEVADVVLENRIPVAQPVVDLGQGGRVITEIKFTIGSRGGEVNITNLRLSNTP